MPGNKSSLQDRFAKSNEITITVTGRKSGKAISLPIWFVFDDGKLQLLPVKGSDTQWYKNALQNPSIRVESGGATADFKARPITDASQVSSVVEKFRHKYGEGNVKKYYSKFDVAVLAQSQSAPL